MIKYTMEFCMVGFPQVGKMQDVTKLKALSTY